MQEKNEEKNKKSKLEQGGKPRKHIREMDRNESVLSFELMAYEKEAAAA